MASDESDLKVRAPGFEQLLELLRNPDVQAGLAEFAGLHVVTDAEKAVLDATARMKLVRSVSSRPPFTEKVVCRGGGEEVVQAECARREVKK